MINLNNFESFIPYRILHRGEDYYDSELVSGLQETEPGEWEATVSGTEDYTVDISIEGDEIVSWCCDCPYDGEICKHVVATVLVIRDHRAKVRDSAFSKPKKVTEEAVVQKEMPTLDFLGSDLQQLLSLAKPEELLQFISQYAAENEEFRKALSQHFVKKHFKPSAQAKDYRMEVQQAFNITYRGGRRSRYHRYYDDFELDWNMIFDQVEKWLKKAELLANSGNWDGAISIALQILRSIGDNLEDELLYDDDLYISDCCERAGGLIIEVVQQPDVPQGLNSDILEDLCQIARIAAYSDYDLYDIDELIMQVNILVQPAEKSLALIDNMLEERKDAYDLYKLVICKIELLAKLHQPDKADEVIRQYLYLDEIRKVKVGNLIEDGQYDEAIRLLDEGIEHSNKKGHIGTTENWLEVKLQIYESLKDTANVIAISRQLFVYNRGEMEYYHKLKALIPAEQWRSFLDNMMNETKFFEDSFAWAESVEAEIYVEEKDVERLFKLLSTVKYNQLKALMKYAHHLKNTHSQQLITIYTSQLDTYAKQNVGREHYEFIASALLCMRKLDGGTEAVKSLVADFRVTYKRRPAMMEVLRGF